MVKSFLGCSAIASLCIHIRGADEEGGTGTIRVRSTRGGTRRREDEGMSDRVFGWPAGRAYLPWVEKEKKIGQGQAWPGPRPGPDLRCPFLICYLIPGPAFVSLRSFRERKERSKKVTKGLGRSCHTCQQHALSLFCFSLLFLSFLSFSSCSVVSLLLLLPFFLLPSSFFPLPFPYSSYVWRTTRQQGRDNNNTPAQANHTHPFTPVHVLLPRRLPKPKLDLVSSLVL